MSRASAEPPIYDTCLSEEENGMVDVIFTHREIVKKISKREALTTDNHEMIAPCTESELRLLMSTDIRSLPDKIHKTLTTGTDCVAKTQILYALAIHYFAGHEINDPSLTDTAHMERTYFQNINRAKIILKIIYETKPFPAATYHYARCLKICGTLEEPSSAEMQDVAQKQGSIAASIILDPKKITDLIAVKKAALLENDPVSYFNLILFYSNPENEKEYNDMCGLLLQAADLGHSDACAEALNIHRRDYAGTKPSREILNTIDVLATKAKVLDQSSANACYEHPFESLGPRVQCFLNRRFSISLPEYPAPLLSEKAALLLVELEDRVIEKWAAAQNVRLQFCRELVGFLSSPEKTPSPTTAPELYVLYQPTLTPLIQARTVMEIDAALQKIEIRDEMDCRILFALALTYLAGYFPDVKLGDTKAFKLFTLLRSNSKLPFAVATYHMAQCYSLGIGVAQDLEKSSRYFIEALAQGSYAAKADQYFTNQRSITGILIPSSFTAEESKLLLCASKLENSASAWILLANQHFHNVSSRGNETELSQHFVCLGMAAKAGLLSAWINLHLIYQKLATLFSAHTSDDAFREVAVQKTHQAQAALDVALSRDEASTTASLQKGALFTSHPKIHWLVEHLYAQLGPTPPHSASSHAPAIHRKHRKKANRDTASAKPVDAAEQKAAEEKARAAEEELLRLITAEEDQAAQKGKKTKENRESSKAAATQTKRTAAAIKEKTPTPKKHAAPSQQQVSSVSPALPPTIPSIDQRSTHSDHSLGDTITSTETLMSAISAETHAVSPTHVASELDPIHNAVKKLEETYRGLEAKIKRPLRDVAHKIVALIHAVNEEKEIADEFIFKTLLEAFGKLSAFTKEWNTALYALYSELKKNEKYKSISDAFEKAYPDLSWNALIEKCATELKEDSPLTWRTLAKKCIADLETLLAHSMDTERNEELHAALQHMRTALGYAFPTEYSGGGGGSGGAGHSAETETEKIASSTEQKRIYKNWNTALNQFALSLPDSEQKLALSAYYLHPIENEEIKNIFRRLKKILAADLICMQGSSILYDQMKNTETEVKPDYDFCIYLGTDTLVIKGIKVQLARQFPDYEITSENLSADFASFTLTPTKASHPSSRKIDLSFYIAREDCKQKQITAISEAFVPLTACYLGNDGQLTITHQDMKNFLENKIILDIRREYSCTNALAYFLKTAYRFRDAIAAGVVAVTERAHIELIALANAYSPPPVSFSGGPGLFSRRENTAPYVAAIEVAHNKYPAYDFSKALRFSSAPVAAAIGASPGCGSRFCRGI